MGQFDMEPKVSIVVAAYNVEAYIEKCLKSIQNQTLKNIEVLIINDGSTDQTPQLCEAFAKQDERFHLISQPHQGLSEARNRGIHEATGKYIAFVDGDDFVHPSMYEQLYNCAIEQYVNFVLCGYTKVWPETKREKKIRVNETIIKKRNKSLYFLEKHDESLVVVWNKLFLRQIILNHQLLFENRTFFEDVSFVARYLSLIDRMGVVQQPLYYYVKREDTVTKSYHPIIEQSHEQTYTLLKNFFYFRPYKKAIETLNLRLYLYRYHYVLKTTSNKRQLKRLERQMNTMRKNYSRLPWKHRFVRLFISFRIYPTIYRLLHRVKV